VGTEAAGGSQTSYKDAAPGDLFGDAVYIISDALCTQLWLVHELCRILQH
jgi:hypothetical protein